MPQHCSSNRFSCAKGDHLPPIGSFFSPTNERSLHRNTGRTESIIGFRHWREGARAELMREGRLRKIDQVAGYFQRRIAGHAIASQSGDSKPFVLVGSVKADHMSVSTHE